MWRSTEAPPSPPTPSDILENPLPSQKRKGCDLWRFEAASQALRPLSSLYTEEEQFMELF